ncbi:MAG: hypothetical protein ABSD75_27800 [Terriglobales bacterium]|jgi:hypothetical protein
MIVIVANRWDQTPKAIVSRWGEHNVGVVTASDLSLAGWLQHSNGADQGTAVIGRKLVPQEEITGVLTLLPCVFEEELVEIAPEDRSYVAAEMTAFLLFWLSRLQSQCLVLNRPTPSCLSGPCWRREKWIHAAAQAGIPVQPLRRHAALPVSAEEEATPSSATVTVVGKCIFGEVEDDLQRQARRLADMVGVELLAVRFSGPERGASFVSADSLPDFSDDGLADAVLAYLRDGPAKCA